LTVRAGKQPGDGLLARAVAEVLLPLKTWILAKEQLSNQHFDRVIFYSPTIFWGWIVNRIARQHRAVTYLVLRDLFPEWALDIGLIRRTSPSYLFLKYVARYQYKTADRIGVQSPSNARQLKALYPEHAAKVEVLWNWTSDSSNQPAMQLSHSLSTPSGRVRFFYGGNLGVAQGVGHLVALARWVHTRSDAHLIIVGSGKGYGELRRTIDFEQLANVALSPPIPQSDYENLLSRIDIGVVLLEPALRTHNIPGKLVSYAMAGKPILADVNSENDLIDLLTEYRAGLVTSGDQSSFLANAKELTENPALRKSLGEGAKRLAHSHFSVERCATQLLANDWESARTPLG
jgi:glycosyltransferase involved in cell wall biosynthesis